MSTSSDPFGGIDFLTPSGAPDLNAADEGLVVALDAPPPYFKRNALSEHLWTAIWHPINHLSAMDHRNAKSGKPFRCLSYYSDDPDVHAYCAVHDEVHLATIGASFVCQLVKICERIGRILAFRPRSGGTEQAQGAVGRDDVLRDLLNGDLAVSDREAETIVASWPAASTDHAQIPLGEFALFYDLIRLIWLHEWAHALCGHVRYISRDLGMLRLYEFSAERMLDQRVDGVDAPRNEVLQALEIHADEFATRYCIEQILRGYDPVGQMSGPTVDLVDRLLIFNTACCVFAMVWSLAEQKRQPGISFYPPRQELTSSAPDPMFVPYNTSHPPAVLRYYRFRGFQRDLAYEAAEYGTPGTLSSPVDFLSYRFVEQLGQADARFYQLISSTPLAVPTPTINRVKAYEQRLLEVLERVSPQLEELGYAPTRDPYADDAEPQDGTQVASAATGPTERSGDSASAPSVAEESSSGSITTAELARRAPEGSLPDKRLSSEEFDSLFKLAEKAHADRDFASAREILHGLIVLDRGRASAWVLLGRVEWAAGRIADAHAALSFAHELEPNNKDVAMELARVTQVVEKGVDQ